MFDFFIEIKVETSSILAYIFPLNLQVIEMSRQAAEHRAQSLLRELEEEIAELQKRTSALSQLAVSEDFVLFLKVWMNEYEYEWEAAQWCSG